ncbi:MAG: RNA polymerase sigma factor RpoD, partial [Betaproteobacteria bacterium]|nr:RNA polymerase sigma factor RpoD [Betaproteobacteria bacterium]
MTQAKSPTAKSKASSGKTAADAAPKTARATKAVAAPVRSTTKAAPKATAAGASASKARASTTVPSMPASKTKSTSAKAAAEKPVADKAGVKAAASRTTAQAKAAAKSAADKNVPADDFNADEPDEAAAPAAPMPRGRRPSRAKEKQLLKEFGYDDSNVTEEELARRRQRLKNLIKLGKTRGFLTYGEINDHLPDNLADPDLLETIISMLNDMGIAVYEQAPDAQTLLLNQHGPTTSSDEEAEEEAEAALSSVDSEFGRTTDPVRMYMREMGTVQLLTREGEIVIAKRIEEGLRKMMLAIS